MFLFDFPYYVKSVLSFIRLFFSINTVAIGIPESSRPRKVTDLTQTCDKSNAATKKEQIIKIRTQKEWDSKHILKSWGFYDKII